MTDEKYNSSWDLIEPIIFDRQDQNINYKVMACQLTKNEALYLHQCYEALKNTVLDSLGTSIEELDNETEKRLICDNEDAIRNRFGR